MEHNKAVAWLREIKKDINGKNKQGRVQISQEKLKKILKQIPNWKAPGSYGVQGFWLKTFVSLHKNLVRHLNACLEGETPRWMTKGRTVLLQKDKSKGNEASNYRPIKCLPLIWKLLARIIADEFLWFSGERRDITRRVERMQKEVKGYWGPVIPFR